MLPAPSASGWLLESPDDRPLKGKSPGSNSKCDMNKGNSRCDINKGNSRCDINKGNSRCDINKGNSRCDINKGNSRCDINKGNIGRAGSAFSGVSGKSLSSLSHSLFGAPPGCPTRTYSNNSGSSWLLATAHNDAPSTDTAGSKPIGGGSNVIGGRCHGVVQRKMAATALIARLENAAVKKD